MIARFAPIALLGSAGCSAVEYDAADLQLDVDGALPDGAETLHVCVEGAGELTQGAGNGRLAFTGLPADTAAIVRLEVYDAADTLLAAAGPSTLDAGRPWASIPLLDDAVPCADAGARAPETAETWLLAVRFAE